MTFGIARDRCLRDGEVTRAGAVRGGLGGDASGGVNRAGEGWRTSQASGCTGVGQGVSSEISDADEHPCMTQFQG